MQIHITFDDLGESHIISTTNDSGITNIQQILQPGGPGFTVDDGCLTWGPWQMRVSLHPIEGLVLHQIGYRDHGRLRRQSPD